ncbi:hypothetical protein LAZ67_8000370 [Cordylochernes scorpioides]|uniref:Mos1 transposase HTH domain-containing protein n=1 Tax=Cordylochernes scorpioides TaxID=51811 RepID=A0ABY6KPF0_9ARAC|nr:hypothetical protein LAZ67_8000370 [Cordylochernes scorpioides]
MELPLVNVSTCELRSVIRFFTAINETAVNIHRNLVSVYGEGCMSIQMVRRWRSWFLEGRDRPVTATDNAAVAAVRNVVEANRRVTIDEIMIRLPPGIEIGCSSIGTIINATSWFFQSLKELHLLLQKSILIEPSADQTHKRDVEGLTIWSSWQSKRFLGPSSNA